MAQCLEEAQAQVAALKTAADEDAAAVSRRQQAARERAARERQERVQTALQEAEQLAQRRQEVERSKGVKAKPERASTTDPQARTMKMGDGGFRPAYNAQFATTTQGGVIVGVAVTSSGSDSGQMPQMVEQLQQRYGRRADGDAGRWRFCHAGGHPDGASAAGGEGVCADQGRGQEATRGVDPFTPRPRDAEGVALWRQRMGTAEAQGDLPGACVGGGVGERGCAEPWFVSGACAWPDEGVGGVVVAGVGAQPAACGGVAEGGGGGLRRRLEQVEGGRGGWDSEPSPRGGARKPPATPVAKRSWPKICSNRRKK